MRLPKLNSVLGQAFWMSAFPIFFPLAVDMIFVSIQAFAGIKVSSFYLAFSIGFGVVAPLILLRVFPNLNRGLKINSKDEFIAAGAFVGILFALGQSILTLSNATTPSYTQSSCINPLSDNATIQNCRTIQTVKIPQTNVAVLAFEVIVIWALVFGLVSALFYVAYGKSRRATSQSDSTNSSDKFRYGSS